MPEEQSVPAVRVDKWLWAALFFKTRRLAAEAVNGGKVDVNGARPKTSRIVRAGDQLTVRRGPYEWIVVVKDISQLRGPAVRAQSLYQETEESVRRREVAAAQMKLERRPQFDFSGRPSKKDRRAMERFKKEGGRRIAPLLTLSTNLTPENRPGKR
jgi:ribosome-associated heat shock protein Hsp15